VYILCASVTRFLLGSPLLRLGRRLKCSSNSNRSLRDL
jgi:hypothetical protein